MRGPVFERVSGLPLTMYNLRVRLGLAQGSTHREKNVLPKGPASSALLNGMHSFLTIAQKQNLSMTASYDPAASEVSFSITSGLRTEDTGFFEGARLVADLSSLINNLSFSALRSAAFSIAIQGGVFALNVKGENPFSFITTLDSVALRPGPDAPRDSAFKPFNIALIFDTPLLVSEFDEVEESMLAPMNELMSAMGIRPQAMILAGVEVPMGLETAFFWSTHVTPARNAVAAYLSNLGLRQNPKARPRGLSRFITGAFEPSFRQALVMHPVVQLIELD